MWGFFFFSNKFELYSFGKSYAVSLLVVYKFCSFSFAFIFDKFDCFCGVKFQVNKNSGK